MICDPAATYLSLIHDRPSRLDELPRQHGIYALRDHDGEIRYIGITRGDPMGFYGRIHGRHAAGSESRSHKFSHGYNTGRMYRTKKDRGPDAILAKRLRTLFARRYCMATFVTVRPVLVGSLGALELAVQALAPAALLGWGHNRDFDPVPEPVAMVDALLDEVRWTAEQRAAIERQAAKQPC